MDGADSTSNGSNAENEMENAQNEKDKLSKSQNDVPNVQQSRPHTSSTYGGNESRARTWGADKSHALKNKSKNKPKKPYKLRQPRIDDCVRTRYPEWQMTRRNDKDIYNANHRSPGPVYIPKIGYVLRRCTFTCIILYIDHTCTFLFFCLVFVVFFFLLCVLHYNNITTIHFSWCTIIFNWWCNRR